MRIVIMMTVITATSGFTLSGLVEPQNLPEVQVTPMGTLNFNVPLVLPSGISGMTPNLSLVYTGGDRSLVPGGFDISGFSNITRDSSYGIYFQGNDRYISSDGGKLISTSVNEYKNEYDNNIVYRITGMCGDGPCGWTAILPDGKKMYFGETDNSYLEGDAAVSGGGRRLWALNRVTDLNNNSFIITYAKDEDGIRPVRIEYTLNPSMNYITNTVEFSYEERSDADVSYAGGGSTRNSKMLTEVTVRNNSNEIRKYSFEYENAGMAQKTRLKKFHEHVEGAEIRLPLQFRYVEENQNYTSQQSSLNMGLDEIFGFEEEVCNAGEFACSLATSPEPATKEIGISGCMAYYESGKVDRCRIGNTQSYGDFNGDGKLDFIRALPTYGLSGEFLNANRQQVSFIDGNHITDVQSDPQYHGLPGSQMYIDMNGDGRSDFVRMKQVQIGPLSGEIKFMVSLSDGSSFGSPAVWELPAGMKIRGTIEDLLKDNDFMGFIQFADMNGDGKTDIIRLGDKKTIAVAFSTGTEFSNAPVLTKNINPGNTGDNKFQTLADFNGDGIQDFVRLDGNSLLVSPGRADGTFSGEKINIPGLATGHRMYRRMQDVNGDGLADFVRLSHDLSVIHTSLSTGYGLKDTVSLDIPGGAVDSGITNFSAPICAAGKNACELASNGLIALAPPEIALLLSDLCTIYSISGKEKECETGKAWGLADMDGDGKDDLIHYTKAGPGQYQPWITSFNENNFDGPTYKLEGETVSFQALVNGSVVQADINGDGRSDMIVPKTKGLLVASLDPSNPGAISEIADGYGKSISVDYAPALNTPGTSQYQNNTAVDGVGGYSLIASTMPSFLVTEVLKSGFTGPHEKSSMSYSNARIKIGPTQHDTKMLGFSEVTSRSYVYSDGGWRESPAYQVAEYIHEHPALGYDAAGFAKGTKVYSTSGGALLSQSTVEYVRPSNYIHANLKKIAVSKSREENFTTTPAITRESSVTSFDLYGNPVESLDRGDVSTAGDDVITSVVNEYTADFPTGRNITVYKKSSNVWISYQNMDYDSRGNLVSLRQGMTPSAYFTVNMTYDGGGQMLSKEENGITSIMEYDGRGYMVSKYDPSSGKSTMKYEDGTGRILSSTDPAGYETEYTYDAYGRMTEISKGGGFLKETLSEIATELNGDGSRRVTIKKAFDGSSMLKSSTLADEWGKTVQEEKQGAKGAVIVNKSYDAFDRLISQDVPHFASGSAAGAAVYTYDSLGRLKTESRPGPNGPVVMNYEPGVLETAEFTSLGGATLRGYAEKMQNPNGQIIYVYKTLDDRTIQMEYQTEYATAASPSSKNSGWTRVRYHYNDAGQKVAMSRGTGTSRSSISDDVKNTVRYYYDSYGRPVKTSDPDSGDTTVTYNAMNQPECTTAADKITMCRVYDERGRFIELREGNTAGVLSVKYNYDEAESVAGTGRITSMQDDTGFTRFHYDGMTGQVTRQERQYQFEYKSSWTGNKTEMLDKNFDIESVYGPSGVLLHRSFPASNIALHYNYYPDGSISSIDLSDPDNHIVENDSSATIASFGMPDALGKYSSLNYANGVKYNYTYDPASGVLTNLKTTGPMETVYGNFTYTFDDEGMIKTVSDHAKYGGVDLSSSYEYDIAHRMTKATGPYGTRDAQMRSIGYIYGADGQPLIMDQKPVDYYDEHKVKQYDRVRYLYDTNSGQGRGHVVTRWRDGNGIFNPGNPGFIPGPGTGKLNSVAGNGKGPCGPGGGTPPLCQDTEFSPGNSANANGAGAGNETLRQDYAYNYQNRVVQVDSTVGPTHQSTVKFAYDASGMRFFKKYEDNNRSIHTYYMAPDYQIRSTNTGEVHTIVVRKPDGILATMSFDEKFHLASNFPASHYTDRLAYQMDNLYDPAQGVSGIFTNMGSAAVMLYKLSEVYDEYVTLAYYVTVILVILTAIFWLISLWREYKITGERETAVMPGNLGMRLTALFSIILFHGMLGASCSGSETSPKFVVPGGGNISGIVQGLMGAHFYSNDAVGSVTLVTNEAGVPITRYVYKPYGELNMELTDVDMDGNGIFYESIYKYNGQEFDYELGVYNYNARNYDQMTGRFMQTDPKFTERAGFDAYDPYSYVSSNPVNFTDPTGESWLSENVKRVKIIRKIGEAGTFIGKIIKKPMYLAGILEGGVDYILSTLNGNKPSIVYSEGNFGIKNSYLADKKGKEGISYTRNGVVHLRTGASTETLRHEFAHADMFFNGGEHDNVWINEILTDLKAGTARYSSTQYLLLLAMGPKAYSLFSLWRLSLNMDSGNPKEIISIYNSYSALVSGNQSEINFLSNQLLLFLLGEFCDKSGDGICPR